ncbi:hypothetical protein HK098_001326 [Nowakowskiella sp. JEL0407]|nr:hypothetical protein HK098_001326 [Nowakowskiella sp. JEL0407]
MQRIQGLQTTLTKTISSQPKLLLLHPFRTFRTTKFKDSLDLAPPLEESQIKSNELPQPPWQKYKITDYNLNAAENRIDEHLKLKTILQRQSAVEKRAMLPKYKDALNWIFSEDEVMVGKLQSVIRDPRVRVFVHTIKLNKAKTFLDITWKFATNSPILDLMDDNWKDTLYILEDNHTIIRTKIITYLNLKTAKEIAMLPVLRFTYRDEIIVN